MAVSVKLSVNETNPGLVSVRRKDQKVLVLDTFDRVRTGGAGVVMKLDDMEIATEWTTSRSLWKTTNASIAMQHTTIRSPESRR